MGWFRRNDSPWVPRSLRKTQGESHPQEKVWAIYPMCNQSHILEGWP